MKKFIKNSWKLIFCLMLLGSQSLILGDPKDYFFSPEEYNYWKNRIKEIHLQAYKKLEACEKDGVPCLLKNPEGKLWIQDPYEESKGHPILMIPDYLKNASNDEIKSLLEYYSRKDYIRPIDRGEITHVLNIIKHIAPELYAELLKVDPTGSGIVRRHYGRGTNAAVSRSLRDGSPIFSITPDFTRLPIGQQYFVIAHELGHYALHHLKETESYTIVHPGLMNVLSKQAYKKSTGRLPFAQTFKYAFSRNQENEADRFAILQFAGLIKIDDAIDFLKKIDKDEADWIKKQQVPGLQVSLRIKKPLELSHPRIQERINHLNNELRRELELALRRPRKTIDWKEIKGKL